MATKSNRKGRSKIMYEMLSLSWNTTPYILSKSWRYIPLPFSDIKSKLIKQANEQAAESKEQAG
jgi:hypothetical protein